MSAMLNSMLDSLRNPSITNQPPTPEEQRRNDQYTIAVLIIAILLGWIVRNGAVNAVDEYSFEGEVPSVVVPVGWITSDSEGERLFSAVDPAGASTFDSRIEVYARPLREGEDLSLINVSWPLQRSQELERFRTISSDVVSGPNGEDALLITYAYIADPTRESGALGLPVVVKGQDLIFIAGEEGAQEMVVVTTAADAAEWESAEEAFRTLFDHLDVQE